MYIENKVEKEKLLTAFKCFLLHILTAHFVQIDSFPHVIA